MDLDALLNKLRDLYREGQEFEPAAARILDAALDYAADALETAGVHGKILRGMLHFRPGGAYRGLVVVERDPESSGVGPVSPSATVWNLVSERGAPLAVDVESKTARCLDTDGQAIESVSIPGPVGSDEGVFASRHRLLQRSATHILALPLHGRPHEIDGMVSLEANSLESIGQPFIWPDIVDDLQFFVDMAVSRLVGLPSSSKSTHDADRIEPDELLPVIGDSMRSHIQTLRIFARQPETVLLSGPTGTGKSRLARWCHAQSDRSDGPFEAVDLLTVPDNLQMAELFGWRRGAFSDAVRDHEGYVARAEGGTLFIDEVDKLSLKAQAGLLRFLEERRYRPLGETGSGRSSDLRVIVGTNADLNEVVAAGDFREDLYYRINVLPIRLPPLDERRDEIGDWAEYMAQRRHEETGGRGRVVLEPAARTALLRQRWPGNLRQLDNVVRRAYTLSLMERTSSPAPTIDAGHVKRALKFEQTAIEPDELLETLRDAARAFALEAARRHGEDDRLSLDHADAFRGFVLAAGLELMSNDKEEVVQMFDKASLLKGRNHYKFFKREAQRLVDLQEALSNGSSVADELAIFGADDG